MSLLEKEQIFDYLLKTVMISGNKNEMTEAEACWWIMATVGDAAAFSNIPLWVWYGRDIQRDCDAEIRNCLKTGVKKLRKTTVND